MNYYCMGCMRERPVYEKICPVCGWNHSSTGKVPYALPLGTLLHEGKYLVGRVLGQGGFGITYIGYDMGLHMKVAVKEYYPQSFASRITGSTSLTWYVTDDQKKTGREKFVKEARMMAKIKKIPNVAQVLEIFYQNNTAYIIMDFVEGETLNLRIRKRGILGEKECIKILKPAMQALSSAHKQGLIHRDISPDNLMIDDEDRVWIIDMGAAKEVDVNRVIEGGSTQSQTIIRRGFSPMEQFISNSKIGPWTDVYAFSATIYFAITGLVPKDALNRLGDPAIEYPEGISERMKKILDKGLSMMAEDRYQTIDELLDALEHSSDNYCMKCGKPVPEDAAFCAYCGTPIIKPAVQTVEITDEKEEQKEEIITSTEAPEDLSDIIDYGEKIEADDTPVQEDEVVGEFVEENDGNKTQPEDDIFLDTGYVIPEPIFTESDYGSTIKEETSLGLIEDEAPSGMSDTIEKEAGENKASESLQPTEKTEPEEETVEETEAEEKQEEEKEAAEKQEKEKEAEEKQEENKQIAEKQEEEKKAEKEQEEEKQEEDKEAEEKKEEEKQSEEKQSKEKQSEEKQSEEKQKEEKQRVKKQSKEKQREKKLSKEKQREERKKEREAEKKKRKTDTPKKNNNIKKITIIVSVIIIAAIAIIAVGTKKNHDNNQESSTASNNGAGQEKTTYITEDLQRGGTLKSDSISEEMQYMNAVNEPVFGTEYKRKDIASIQFQPIMPEDPGNTGIDVSDKQDGSVKVFFNKNNDKTYDMVIASDGYIEAPIDCSRLFMGYTNLQNIDFGGCFDTSHTTNMKQMFEYCDTLETLDLSCFDTSKVTDMSYMFALCTNLKSLNACNLDGSSLTEIKGVFDNMNKFEELDLSNTDIMKISDLAETFVNQGKSMTIYYPAGDVLWSGAIKLYKGDAITFVAK